MKRRDMIVASAAAVLGGANLIPENKVEAKTTGSGSVGLNWRDEQRRTMKEQQTVEQFRAKERREAARARRDRFAKLEKFREAVGITEIHQPGAISVPFATLPVSVYIRGDVYQQLPDPGYAFFRVLSDCAIGRIAPYAPQLIHDGLKKHLPRSCKLGDIPRPLTGKPSRICSSKLLFDTYEAEFDGTADKRAAVALSSMYTSIANEIRSQLEATRKYVSDSDAHNRWDGPTIVEPLQLVVEVKGPMLECWAFTHVMWEKQATELHAEYKRLKAKLTA
jgi:hypothetical protein